MRSAVIIFAACIAAIAVSVAGQAPSSLSCLQTTDHATGAFTSMDCPTYMCAVYNYTCTNGDSSCTAEEIAASANKRSQVCSSPDTCASMKTAPTMYRNLLCCDTNDCNTADLHCKVTAADGTVSTPACLNEKVCVAFNYTCSVNDNENVCSPAEETAGTNKRVYKCSSMSSFYIMENNPSIYVQPGYCTTNDCDPVYVPPAPVAAPSAATSVKCFNGYGSTITSIQCDYGVCISYKFTCIAGDSACTAEEISAATTKRSYTCGTQSLCNDMKAAPSLYQETKCCTSDYCNTDQLAPATIAAITGSAASLMISTFAFAIVFVAVLCM